MKTLLKKLLVLNLLICVSCASNVKTKKYTDEDLTNYKTFAYLPNTTFSAAEYDNNADTSVEASLIEMMNEKMTEKGFTVNSDNPDLLVLLTTSNDIQSNLRNRDNYKQPPNTSSSGGNPNYASVTTTDRNRYFDKSDAALSNRPFKTGTLVVEVFNTSSKELLWLGVAENFKAHISDQTLMSRMISEIFNEFPN